jgi:GntR family transcriptional regulator
LKIAGMEAQMPLPKYHQVYLLLREQLQEGRFGQGLPGEHALSSSFGVARITVRRALQQLADEGLITREPGRGTRATALAGPPTAPGKGKGAPERKAQLSGLLENLVTMGLQTRVKVLSVEVVGATDEVAHQLQLQPGTQVQKAQRVRSTSDGPLSHITTWVPQTIACHFDRKALSQKPILMLLEASGVQVGRAVQTLSAKLADAEVARHLDVAVGSALLSVRRLILDDQDRPVQWLHGLYRPDRYEYAMQLSRVGSIDAKVWVSQELTARFS